MKTELFETIYNNLKERVDWCDINLGPIHTKSDLENLNASTYIKIKNKCLEYLSDMDKIYTELNHIYGMGNLTVQQQSKLYSIMRRFTNYRSDIKCLATHSDANTLPSVPKSRDYKLSVLANVNLHQPARGQKEEEVEVKEVDNNSNTYYSYVNQNKDKIKLMINLKDETLIQNVYKEFAQCMGSAKLGKKFTSKMRNGGSSHTIVWSVVDGISRCVLEKNCLSHSIFFDHFAKKLEA